MNALLLYSRYLSVSVRSSMQYRASFVLQSLGHFLITALEFLGLAAVFQRFGQIQGWTLPEIGLFYGIIGIAFSLAEPVPRAFDTFPRLVRSGDFDRILLRPRTAAFQVLRQDVQLMRVGRFSQALIVLIWASRSLHIGWTAAKIMLLISSIVGGACLFSGLFILAATMCFWTIDSIEIINCATYCGVEVAQFPLTIYQPWLRDVFIFIIPLATINYLPAHAILGRTETAMHSTVWIQCALPAVGVIFLIACLQGWRFGVRYYRSTGS